MSLKINRINQQTIDSTIQAASDASIDNTKKAGSTRAIDLSKGAESEASIRHTVSTEGGTKNYNSLVNKPIINEDLNYIDPLTIIVDMGYRHIGETNEIFTQNKLYFFDGEDWHELGDYEDLLNLPTINGVTIVGALNGLDLGITNILYNTTAFWDSQLELRSERNTLYIYTDKFSYRPSDESPDIIVVEGIKIGDGNAYLIDKPFITDAISFALDKHMSDTTVHISQAERTVWNNKLNYKDPGQTDLLEFTRN